MKSPGRKKPTELDRHIGSRIRLWRRTLNVDANALASNVGITYQQLQKYEKGMNRIGAARLFEFARLMDVPIDFFYPARVPPTTDQNARDRLETGVSFLTDGSTIELFKCYSTINHTGIRRALIGLLRSIAASYGTGR